MIIQMAMIRLIGRKADLPRTLAALQDVGTLHLTEPVSERGVSRWPARSPSQQR